MLSRLPMLIARRPLITSRAFLQHGSRCYGVLHAAPPRLAHPRPGPVASSLMSIAGAAIVTWTFYKVIWDDALATRVLQQQPLPNVRELDEDYLQSLEWCIMFD
ncbi:hypothetical protein F5880DRAFT_1691284 [Lentinula raphanica]|nr:hypothetical protein EV360DRAFT_77696 [Lentinula raphanica]KAJ3830581.1 hypothetical protein F5880DRAFT_1691284 [Lentinula raphanica]